MTSYKLTAVILSVTLSATVGLAFGFSGQLDKTRDALSDVQSDYSNYKLNAERRNAELCIENVQLQLDNTQLQSELETAVAPISNTEYLGEFTITYYDACMQCCGKTDGITASGAIVREGVTVAVDPKVVPLGAYIYIEGIGYRVAQDTGGAIKGNRIDVYVNTHQKALNCGVAHNVKVWVMNPIMEGDAYEK